MRCTDGRAFGHVTCSQLLSDHLKSAHICGVGDPFRDRYLREQRTGRCHETPWASCAAGAARLPTSGEVTAKRLAGDQEAALHELVASLKAPILVLDRHGAVVADAI